MKKVTAKQQDIIDFIKNFVNSEGMAPTVQEIAEFFRIKSSTTFSHIRSLQEKGILRRSSKARSISLIESDGIRKPFHTSFSLDIPLLGRINAGYAIDMEQNMSQHCEEEKQKNIQFDAGLFPYKQKSDLFCLEITGDSMQEAGIFENDYVIVQKTTQVKNSDLVVALVNKSETTVKYYYKNGNMIELKPANYQYISQKYRLEQVELQGIVIGLQRKF